MSIRKKKNSGTEIKPLQILRDECLIITGLPLVYMEELENLAKAMYNYSFLAQQEKLDPFGALNAMRELNRNLQMSINSV